MILSKTGKFAVEYVTGNGTYDILQVVPGTDSRSWPIKGNRDWKQHAIEFANKLDDESV
jgi:hypothetical protein